MESPVECAITRPIMPVIGAVLAVVLLVGLGSTWFGSGTTATAAQPPFVTPDRSTVGPSELVVHVSGAVVHPGLVTVAAEARVADAISAAGGATRSADLSRLNLAAPVRDAEHIDVPSIEDAGRPGATSGADGIDLNAADAAMLERLPGVGPVLAARIVAHRDEHGPFATIEDLLDVPGIGEAKLAQLRDAVNAP